MNNSYKIWYLYECISQCIHKHLFATSVTTSQKSTMLILKKSLFCYEIHLFIIIYLQFLHTIYRYFTIVHVLCMSILHNDVLSQF